MKKKFNALQSQIGEQKQNCEKLGNHEQELQKVTGLNPCWHDLSTHKIALPSRLCLTSDLSRSL